jgi:hypothetical protein
LLTAREIIVRKGSALPKAKTAPLLVSDEKKKIGLNN